MKKQTDTDKKVIALIKMAEKVLETATTGHQKQYINEKKFHDFRISGLSFLSVLFGEKSPFYKEFEKEVTSPTPVRAERGLGILTAVQRELQGDWLKPIRGEVYNSLERNMLKTCQTQVRQGQKLTAISLATGVLDSHLRSLCVASDISISKEQDGKQVDYTSVQLNSRAYKKNLFERKINKKLFSALELQAKAGSEGVAEISDEEVNEMINSILTLVISHPCVPAE